jgi:hypothetical protein
MRHQNTHIEDGKQIMYSNDTYTYMQTLVTYSEFELLHNVPSRLPPAWLCVQQCRAAHGCIACSVGERDSLRVRCLSMSTAGSASIKSLGSDCGSMRASAARDTVGCARVLALEGGQ